MTAVVRDRRAFGTGKVFTRGKRGGYDEWVEAIKAWRTPEGKDLQDCKVEVYLAVNQHEARLHGKITPWVITGPEEPKRIDADTYQLLPGGVALRVRRGRIRKIVICLTANENRSIPTTRPTRPK